MEEQKLLKRKRKATTENNQTLLISACTDLAEVYVKEGRYNLAIKEYEIIADIYKMENKLIEYAQAHRAIGEAYLGLNNFEKALEHQRLYLNVANQENNELEQQRALATMGHIYLTWFLETQTDPEKRLNSAYKYFMKSLMIAESLTGINKLEKVDMMARLFSNLGLVKESLGDFNKALELLNRSIVLCKQHDIYEQLHRGYISIASLYEKRGEYNEAIRHYNLAIDSAKKLKSNVSLMCAALLVKSEALIKLADFHSAKQVLVKAYKLKTPNIIERRLIERNLKIVAAMCYTEDKLVMASDNGKDRKSLYEKMGDGACDLKNYSKAIEYYKLMLECAERSGVGGRELASCYYSLAETYKDNEQYSEAIAYFEKELVLCKDLKDSLNTLSNIADTKEAAAAPVSEVRAVYEKAFAECRRARNMREEKRMILRCIAYMRRNNSHAETFELSQYLKNLEDINLEDASSSEDESQDSLAKACMGDDINLDAITDESDDSDIENQQSTSKNGTVVGKRRNKSYVVKKNAKGESELHVACINGRAHVVHHLLELGHPVNIRDNSGWLPLHEACNHGYVDIVRFLLDKGAAINDRGGTHCNGITPLYDAANNGHLKVVELLLDRGASAIVKTDDGDTPLNILKEWQKNNPLYGDDLVLYQSLVKRMGEAMEKAGQNSKSGISNQVTAYSQCSTVEKVDKNQQKRQARRMVEDCSDNDEDSNSSSQISGFDATDEYIKVMGTLRKKTNNVNVPTTSRVPLARKKSALIVTENDHLDDWLEDDMQASKVTKKRRTGAVSSLMTPAARSSGSQPESAQKKATSPTKNRPSDDFEVPDGFFDADFDVMFVEDQSSPAKDKRQVAERRVSTESVGGVKRKNQATLLDAGFSKRRSDSPGTSFKRTGSFEKRSRSQQPKITNFGQRSVVEADSTTPVSSQAALAVDPMPTQSLCRATGDLMVFVDVKVEGRVFRVPVLLSQVQSNTIGWLAEQAANKYARKECSRPTLELETTTGALLSDEDPLSLLFPLGATQAEPVVGRVVKLSLPPLVDRYKEATALMETDIDESLCSILEEISVTLSLSNRGILGKSLAPLCRALSHQSTLLELDLSGNFLDTDCVTKLCAALPTLMNLNTLNLRCTGLTSVHLAEFVKAFTSNTAPVLQKLSNLDLSDNFLRDRSLKHLSRITAHLKLAALKLSNVKFTGDLFRNCYDEDSRLHLSEIRCLDVSDNELRVEDVRKILSWTSASRLVSLNVSRNCRKDAGALGVLVDALREDLCGVELRSLELSRCGVQENEVYEFLRLLSGNTLLDINLSYNPNLTGVSLRRLLEHPSLQTIDLIGCVNILRYFDDCGGCDLLRDSDVSKEKSVKLSADLRKFPGQAAVLADMFKKKYGDCYVEQTDSFLFLSSKMPADR